MHLIFIATSYIFMKYINLLCIYGEHPLAGINILAIFINIQHILFKATIEMNF